MDAQLIPKSCETLFVVLQGATLRIQRPITVEVSSCPCVKCRYHKRMARVEAIEEVRVIVPSLALGAVFRREILGVVLRQDPFGDCLRGSRGQAARVEVSGYLTRRVRLRQPKLRGTIVKACRFRTQVPLLVGIRVKYPIHPRHRGRIEHCK